MIPVTVLTQQGRPRTSLRLSIINLSHAVTFLAAVRVPRGNIPRERAAQCACAGTYSVCIAPTQRGQQFFENSQPEKDGVNLD